MSDPSKPDLIEVRELQRVMEVDRYSTRVFARAIKIIHDETEGLAEGEWRDLFRELMRVEDSEWTTLLYETGAGVDAAARCALSHAFPQRLPQ